MKRSKLIEMLVRLALEEDCASRDVTARLTIDGDLPGEGVVLAREPLLVAGIEVLPIVIKVFGDKRVRIFKQLKDGTYVNNLAKIAVLRGPMRSLLSIERTVLNLLQRTCGVATFTRETVKGIKGITILDTRKTMPGFRVLDKLSVKVGGAENHRMSLSDLIMVKNNHIDANGGDLAKTLDRLYSRKPKNIKVEVEVRNRSELEIALRYNPEIIMLDNMDNEEIREAVEIVRKLRSKTQLEASGGITRERLVTLAKIGVDFVSMGRLTTQARNVDISMRIRSL